MMGTTWRLLAVCLFLGIVSLAHCNSFSPTLAEVVNVNEDQKRYTAFFEGSPDMVVYWEDRWDTIFPKNADEMMINQDEASASLLLTGFHEVVRLMLYESERDMAGSRVYFLHLQGEEQLPTLHVTLSSDVINLPNETLNITVTVDQTNPASFLDEFDVSAEFVGVDRSSGSPEIIKIPSYEHQAHIVCNKLSQEGDTYIYQVIPPQAEGLLFVRSSVFAKNDRPSHPGIATVSVVKVLPAGATDLFEDGYLGVKSNKYGTGELPCPSASSVRCMVECVAFGPDIQGIELYGQNNALAYTTREDIRHGDTFMRSRFSYDDKTVGEKGQLTCQVTDGSRVVNDTFDMFVFKHIDLTSFGVERDGDQRVFHCSFTGYPKPEFKIYVTDKEKFYDTVEVKPEVEDGVWTITYRYNYSDNVSMLNCQAQSKYSFNYKKIDNPE